MSEKREAIKAALERLGGNVSAVSRELRIPRATVTYHRGKLGITKPLTAGSVLGTPTEKRPLPPLGEVKRYILTSAQNNTRLHERAWESLLALRSHYGAELLVGTFSYNKNAYGRLATKRGTATYDTDLWFDERIEPFTCDKRVELAHGLVWCGEMNILPTADDPLASLETYSGRKSAVIPHAKVSMRSIAAMKGEPVKFNYTTGTVTQRNYVQKKAGLKAEHHHSYGGLIVEVDGNGNWWVRQLDADDKGRIYDLNVLADGSTVTTKNRLEAITWGDWHSSCIDASVAHLSLGKGGMLETLRPHKQFAHDVMEGVATNHHGAKDPHAKFQAFLRGLDVLRDELKLTCQTINAYHRPWCRTFVVDSNHDGQWLYKWLREHDYRMDPANALLFLRMQTAVYEALELYKPFNVLEWAMNYVGGAKARFLMTDESCTLVNGRIEAGMHGHLGPGGARATPKNLAKIGRRANIGHTHSAGIYDGLYVAGTSSNLDMGYNKGPSAWSHTHILTYANGKRSMVTMFAGKWRA